MADTIIVRECLHGQVRVMYGDLTKEEGDVLVTPANNRLAGREGVDEMVHQAAGPELREHTHGIAVERRKENLPPCGVGEAVVTPTFSLPHGSLVHVVGPDCRRPTQDSDRRELLKAAYASLFKEIEGISKRDTIVLPPLSMDIFQYPHREGARMTMEIVLAWMDSGDDPGVKKVKIITQESNFIKNMKTVYRESEDRFPGVDRTREYRRGLID